MPLQKAKEFIENLRNDRSLHMKMNQLSPEQVQPYLLTIGFIFSFEEFEDAANYYKLRALSEQDAFDIDEIKFWFQFLITKFEKQ